MALPLNLQQLLHGRVVEWERLEFKAGWNPQSTIHALCAFANDFHNWGGGYILVGIAEDHGRPVLPPVGLPATQLDAIQKEMVELGHRLRPAYHPIMEPTVIDGRHVLIIWAPGGDLRPYQAPISLGKDHHDYAYYIRRGSVTVRAQGANEQELLGLANRVPFDDRINTRAAVSDLQLPLMQNFLREVRSDLLEESRHLSFEALCQRLHVVGGPAESLRPLNVGLLFFNSDPTTFFPQTQIDVVEFPDGRGGDTFTEKIFKGPLSAMLREALSYLRNSIVKEYIRKHPDRAEAERYFNVPYAALEESLVNSAYHRSYQEREPIEVQVTPEEITITSYPGPDRSIDMTALQQGRAVVRRYRNRRIGEFLKELELSEGRGTGIPKILRVMQDNGSAAPVFETDEERSHFLVRLPLRSAPGTPQATPQVTPQVGDAISDYPATSSAGTGEVTPQVTPQVEEAELRRVLAFCSTPRSAAEIRKHFGFKDRQHFQQIYLDPALAHRWIEKTIPGKPRSSRQRYVLTDLGRMWLETK